ncbi:unnamed protein product, partial [Larinioides sclopetarius]
MSAKSNAFKFWTNYTFYLNIATKESAFELGRRPSALCLGDQSSNRNKQSRSNVSVCKILTS